MKQDFMKQKPSRYLLEAARSYSIYVSTERAIPDVRDGFKSSHRIAVWCMRNEPNKLKVNALSGRMVGESLYVHGDASGAISGMAGPYCNNIPIFDKQGNFGSLIAPKAFGAGRYTYVKKSKFMENVVLADSSLLKMVPSVDGDNEMCEVFLPNIPLVLLNGISGTGIGWSTDILPHKFEDLRDAVIRVLENKPVGKIKPYFNPYPDIGIEEVENGRDNASSYILSGKIRRKDSMTVEIYSVPPGISMDDIQEHLDKLIEDKRIYNYTNNTTSEVSIEVKFARKTLAEMTDDQIVQLLKLKTRTTERLVCVDFDGAKIRVFNDVEELITEWVSWRFEFIVERFDRLVKENRKALNFQKALRRLFEKEFVKSIPLFQSRKSMREAVVVLVDEFDLTSEEIDRIVNFAAYRWTQEFRDENNMEIDRLEKELFRVETIRSSNSNMRSEWCKELKSLKF
ncbi:topoisomerase IV subunit A [Agrobacterium phage Atu_ph04]|uniref:DNA topoisomerase (ATP-hydrolyzing) n=1 Tax=Agrobacterium phage Atu_ph04 TaxID=2024263 RepID=A0A223VZU8_9CAUD|nr:topoisomerase IV subunit A [Agrobacterium phage Atu_ph04]ASV44654.2 topoisomerase IV subunit A [Agrobacterium phage Atu_ph04]